MLRHWAPMASRVFALDIQSSADAEQVKKLIQHAERGCHAEQTMRKPIAVATSAMLNKKKLDPAN
jgi:signal recognition particle GTPase